VKPRGKLQQQWARANKAAITSADDFIAGFMGVRIVFLSALGTPPSQNILLRIFHALFAHFF
jgi:hypothetical protein